MPPQSSNGYERLSNPAEAIAAPHSRTDAPCLMAFVGFWVLFLICTALGLGYGEPRRLYHGFDFAGRLCGVDVPGKPMLYWPSPTSMQYPVCFKECPTDDTQQILLPVDEVNKEENMITISSSQKWVNSYPSKPLAGRYCLPVDWPMNEKSKSLVLEEAKYTNSAFLSHFADLMSAGPILGLIIPLAVASGYGYLLGLRKAAKIILWVFAVLVILLALLCSIYCFTEPQGGNLFSEYAAGDAQTTSVLWGFFGILFVLFVVVLMIAFRKSIDACVSCTEHACSVMLSMPRLSMLPVVEVGAKLLFLLIWVAGFGFVVSMGTISQARTNINGVEIHGILRTFSFSPLEQFCILVYLWGLIWGMETLCASFQFAIAHSTVKWYFKEATGGKKLVISEAEVHSGVMVAIQHHLGSLALGAAIVGPFNVVNKVLAFIFKQSKSGNRATAPIVKALSCCVICFERFFQYLTKSAYVEIALQGESFMPSAQRAVKVVADGMPQVTILFGMCWIFNFLGTAVISGSVGFLVLACTTSMSTFTSDGSTYFISNPTIVALFSGMIAFVVSVAFMSTFDMVSDSMLYCHLRDNAEHGDGDSKYEPKSLQDLVRVHGSEAHSRNRK